MDSRLVALVTYGNAALGGQRLTFPTLQHLRPGEQLKFFHATCPRKECAGGTQIGQHRDAGGDRKARHLSPFTCSADEWFESLANDGIIGLRLLQLSGNESWNDAWKVDGVSLAIAAIRADGRVDLWHQSHDSWSRTVDYAGRTVSEIGGISDREVQKARERSPWGIVKAIVTLQGTALEDTWFGKVLHTALSVILLPFTLAFTCYRLVAGLYRGIWLIRQGRSFFDQSPRTNSGWHYLYYQVHADELGAWQPKPLIADSHAALAQARQQLIASVETALCFAKQYHSAFIANFERSLVTLESRQLTTASRDESLAGIVPPQNLPPIAEALLVAARQSWVFGGMMSWNDFSAPDGPQRHAVEADYARVTSTLYAAANCAIQVAVEASLPPAARAALPHGN